MPFDTAPGMHPGAIGPAIRGRAITPDDGQPLPLVARKIWVGGAGNVKVMLRDDFASNGDLPVTFVAVPAGYMLEVWAKQVFATGTTATNLIALG